METVLWIVAGVIFLPAIVMIGAMVLGYATRAFFWVIDLMADNVVFLIAGGVGAFYLGQMLV